MPISTRASMARDLRPGQASIDHAVETARNSSRRAASCPEVSRPSARPARANTKIMGAARSADTRPSAIGPREPGGRARRSARLSSSPRIDVAEPQSPKASIASARCTHVIGSSSCRVDHGRQQHHKIERPRSGTQRRQIGTHRLQAAIDHQRDLRFAPRHEAQQRLGIDHDRPAGRGEHCQVLDMVARVVERTAPRIAADGFELRPAGQIVHPIRGQHVVKQPQMIRHLANNLAIGRAGENHAPARRSLFAQQIQRLLAVRQRHDVGGGGECNLMLQVRRPLADPAQDTPQIPWLLADQPKQRLDRHVGVHQHAVQVDKQRYVVLCRSFVRHPERREVMVSQPVLPQLPAAGKIPFGIWWHAAHHAHGRPRQARRTRGGAPGVHLRRQPSRQVRLLKATALLVGPAGFEPATTPL